MGGACRIPLPASAARPQAAGEPGAGETLVAAFLDATAALSCEAVATLAGVRPETIRNWRRRPPRMLRAGTARRLHAHLTGDAGQAPDAGFHKVFRKAMRATSAIGT